MAICLGGTNAVLTPAGAVWRRLLVGSGLSAAVLLPSVVVPGAASAAAAADLERFLPNIPATAEMRPLAAVAAAVMGDCGPSGGTAALRFALLDIIFCLLFVRRVVP